MKIKEDGSGLTLESAEEVEGFRQLVAFGRRLRDEQRQRAERVYSAFIEGNELVDMDDPSDSGSISANAWAKKMSEAIASDLDHRSISDFVELILKSHESASQAAKAHKRHAEHRAMKEDVFVWLDANMQRFKSMDAAAEAIAGKVAPVKFRAARDWVGEWRKLRSTGTP